MSGDPSKPDSLTFQVTTLGHQLLVSRELLEQYAPTRVSFDFMSYLNPKPEQAAEFERRRAEADRKRAEQYAANLARHNATRDLLTAGVLAYRLRDVLDLHEPNGYGDCNHCQDGEYDAEWPCETWRLAAGEEAAS